MDKTILVMGVAGYDRNMVPNRIQDEFHKHEGGMEWGHDTHGYHRYYYNSEGYQLLMITNHSIPDGTKTYDVWNAMWEAQEAQEIEHSDDGRTEWICESPIEFFVDGQRYLYLGEIWGYYSDSINPDDDRYQE